MGVPVVGAEGRRSIERLKQRKGDAVDVCQTRLCEEQVWKMYERHLRK